MINGQLRIYNLQFCKYKVTENDFEKEENILAKAKGNDIRNVEMITNIYFKSCSKYARIFIILNFIYQYPFF